MVRSMDVPRSAHRERTRYGDPSPSNTRMKRRSSCMPSSLAPSVCSAQLSSCNGPQVRVLQENRILLYRMHLLAGHVPRARTCVPKDLEAARPSAIIDIIHSGEASEVKDEIRATQNAQRAYTSPLLPSQSRLFVYIETCKRCGYIPSNDLCKACYLSAVCQPQQLYVDMCILSCSRSYQAFIDRQRPQEARSSRAST